MSENKITFPVKLASNNPQSFGIVDATEISGHKSVDTLSGLYAISDPVLSTLKDGSDAIGQEWFVVSEDCKYRLDNWANRKSIAGWTKLPKQELINTKQSVSQKDQPNGYAGLDSNGKIPIEKTYGTTATVVDVKTYESLPVTGLSGVIYYVSNTGMQYKWSGSYYVDITDGADNAKKNETSIFDCSNGTSTKYYASLSAAINVVPPVYRTSNRIISYLSTENATTKAVNYQYNGIDSTTWTNLTKWERIPNQSDLAEIRSDLNELDSSLNVYREELDIDVDVNYTDVQGRVPTSTNKLTITSGNWGSRLYPVTANVAYNIQANILSLQNGFAFAAFIQSYADNAGATVIKTFSVGEYVGTYTPLENGYIIILETVSGAIKANNINVSYKKTVEEFIDFQNQIGNINEIVIPETPNLVSGVNKTYNALNVIDSSLDVYRETLDVPQTELGTGHYRTLTPTSTLNAVGDNITAKYYKVFAGKKYNITGSSQYLSTGWGLVYFQSGETIVPEGSVEILQPSGVSTFNLTFIPTVDGHLFIQTIITTYTITSTVNLEVYSDEFIDFQNQIDEIVDDVSIIKSDIENLSYVDIYIPHIIYAVVGDTLQLFYKSIINTTDIDKYDIRFVGNVGKCFPRYFEFLPAVSDLGDKTLTIELKNDKGIIVKSKSFTIKVVPAPVSPISHVNVATFGDSLSFGGIYQHEAERRLISSDVANGIFPAGKNLQNISLVGTMDYLNTKYYGIGGWAWVNYATQSTNGYRFYVNGVTGLSVGAEYTQGALRFVIIEVNITDGIGNILTRRTTGTTAPSVSGTLNKASGTGDSTITYTSYVIAPANPLWDNANNKMSYLPYINSCTTNGEVSLITFLLGWNILYVDLTPNIAYIKTLIETAHLEYPDATVALFGVQLPSLNGGLAANYTNNSLLSDLNGVIKMVHDYNFFLQTIADEYDYVDYVDIASQFDSENNMPESIRQVNIRNTKTELIGTNGVHPSDAGYYQIADVFYRYIVGRLLQ